jgi:hypothetical protein
MLTIQKKQAKYFAFRREKAPVESGFYNVSRLVTNLLHIHLHLINSVYEMACELKKSHIIRALLVLIKIRAYGSKALQ